VSLATAAGLTADDVLKAAASLEKGSEHPLASAIVSEAERLGLSLGASTAFRARPGQGVVGIVEGRDVALGNEALMSELRVDLGAFHERTDALRRSGQTVMFVSIGGMAAGIIGVADSAKASTSDALARLRGEGLRVIMLTGDNEATALAVGNALNLDRIVAGVSPAGKLDVIKQLQSEGRKVAMAGDGVNDAPALAQADVGIAMGTGTDVAIQNAGITLVKGDLLGLVRARRLSRAIMSNIRQNLFFAFIYNLVGVPIAAGLLYPFFGWLMSPMLAAAAMSLSSVSVISNALRLRHTDL
jgi:Cu+-exporting ATPase